MYCPPGTVSDMLWGNNCHSQPYEYTEHPHDLRADCLRLYVPC